MNRAHDYEDLRDQFVHGTMSLHELCRKNDIKNHSSVTAKARRDDWAGERERFQNKADDKADDLQAAQQAKRRVRAMEVTDHAFDAVDAVLLHMMEDLQATHYVKRHDEKGEEIWVQEPLMRVTPTAAAAIIDRLNALISGRPSGEGDRGSLNLNIFNGLDREVIAAFASAAGERAAPRTAGVSPIPLLTGPSEA